MLRKPAGGVGLGVARAFAASALNIVVNRFAGRAVIDRALVLLAERYGIEAPYFPAGMTRPDDIARMVDWTTETFGAFDVQVNTKGI